MKYITGCLAYVSVQKVGPVDILHFRTWICDKFQLGPVFNQKKIKSVNQLTPEDERFNAIVSKLHRPKKKAINLKTIII